MKQDMDLIAKSQVETFVNRHKKNSNNGKMGLQNKWGTKCKLTFLKHLVTRGLKKRVTSTTTGGMANVQHQLMFKKACPK